MEQETLVSQQETTSVKDNGFRFKTPADVQDLQDQPAKQALLNNLWHRNLTGFTHQAILGNPYTQVYSDHSIDYIDPTQDDAGPWSPAPIEWSPFPGRIRGYFQFNDPDTYYRLADTGYQDANETISFPPVPADPCNKADTDTKPFGPYGPRGWQDEYCEWAVIRNANNKITRIDFTCENPEYFYSLWQIDPDRVAEIYSNTLDKTVRKEDLYLTDPNTKQVIIDPSTGLPAYNPLNAFNSGPKATTTSGGAMHLTSTPNTLQTEIGLASLATILREKNYGNFNDLCCCSQYGQVNRNSDPNIGGKINTIVKNNDGISNQVTLKNPPGLYIQMPDLSLFEVPSGYKIQDFLHVRRGHQAQSNGGGTVDDYILHLTLEVPASTNLTVYDIKINGKNIDWAGQVAETFTMRIMGEYRAGTKKSPKSPCADDATNMLPQPLQLFHEDVFKAMINTTIKNPVGQDIPLLSNSSYVPPVLTRGQSYPMVLTMGYLLDPDQYGSPVIRIKNAFTFRVSVTKPPEKIYYATPGNSYPSEAWALYLNVHPNPDIDLNEEYKILVTYPALNYDGVEWPYILNLK
ncbi:hypothetical protein [Chitinophaga sp.]|uniref:hypothetical protein n=1 Tax=Chitinophaga sp. TaxID=1869181 RepID=UPI0031D72477